MEYIEREVAKNAFPKAEADAFENCRYCTCLDSGQIGEILDNVPAADVVPVVRCADCKHNNACLTQAFVEDESRVPFDRNTFFCADGKRDDARWWRDG